jgi:SsrA-binding protein
MSSKHKKGTKNVAIKNKRANFEYTLLDKYIAGIVLTGTEIKSVRAGKVNLQESYCYFAKGELWSKGMHIAVYEPGNIYNHIENRERKLLLNKKELNKLMRNKEKGWTIIPIQLFINERGLAKLQIALAKGKKLYDKRQSIKERDLERATQRGQI